MTWTATQNHFPVLQRLKADQCPCQTNIPQEFGNISILKCIELGGCSGAVINYAREIQKEQERNGSLISLRSFSALE